MWVGTSALFMPCFQTREMLLLCLQVCSERARVSVRRMVRRVFLDSYIAGVLTTSVSIVRRLGLIRPENSVEVLDAILHLRQSTSSSEHIFNTKASLPLLPHFWRGRMGLDKAEQLQLLSRARSQTSQTGSDGELSGALRPHASRL